MLERLSRHLRIGVAADGIALIGRTGWPRRRASAPAERAFAGSPLPELAALLDEADCRRASASVVLADSWVRYFFVTPPVNAASLDDNRAAAALRFEQLYGDTPAQWTLRADWAADRPFLACALPRTLADGLAALAAQHALTLTGVAPHFVLAWNRWQRRLPAGAWLAVPHAGMLTLGVAGPRGLHAVLPLPLPACPDAAWLAAQLEREALRHGVDAPGQPCFPFLPGWLADAGAALEHGTQSGLSPALQLLHTQGAAP